MSFSSEVKEELSKHPGKSRHCQIAELAALFVFDGKIEMTDSGCDMYLDSESEVVNRKYELLERLLFQNRQSAQGVSEKQQKQRLYEMVKLWDEVKKIPVQTDVVNGLLLQQSCCKRAYIRGAFLAGGSISDPNKAYHFEMPDDGAGSTASEYDQQLFYGCQDCRTQETLCGLFKRGITDCRYFKCNGSTCRAEGARKCENLKGNAQFGQPPGEL